MADDKQNQQLNDRLDEFLRLGQEDNEAWSALAQDAEDYIYGNQLKNVAKKDGWDRIVANYIYPAMMQQMALMAQRRMKIVTEPWEDGDVAFADFYRGLEQWRFDRTLGMNRIGLEATTDGAIHGYYVAKVVWEPKVEWLDDQKRWRGEPKVRVMRPEYFGMDPNAETLADATFVYAHRRELLDKVLERWPAQAEAIKLAARENPTDIPMPGIATYGGEWEHRSEGQEGEAPDPKTEGRLVNLLRQSRGYGETASKDAGKEREDGLPMMVTITEFYFRDGATRSGRLTAPVPFEELMTRGVIVKDEATQMFVVGADGVIDGKNAGDLLSVYDVMPEEVVREWKDEPVYPNGRVILRIGKDLILNDKPEVGWDEGGQVWPFRSWPFKVGINQILPHVWRGLNAVEMPRSLQDWKNVAFAHMANYLKMFADPILMTETGAVPADPGGEKAKKTFRARAGAIWQLAKGGIAKVKRDPPPPMSAGLIEIDALISRELQDQTGMQEVARGRQAGGNPTATEVQELSRTSKVRTSLASILQDEWMESIMQLVAEMDQRYLSPEDKVRIVGQKAAQRLALASEGTPEDGHDVRFDLSLKIGTALPYDQARKKEEAAELFKAVGVAMLPELLSAFDVENADEVLARHEAWQALLQFMQQQQAMEQEARAHAEVMASDMAGQAPPTVEVPPEVPQPAPVPVQA